METSSAFTGEGFKPFPNTYSDNQYFVANLANREVITDEMIENKLAEYYQFMDRDDIMIRARTLGGRVIAHCNFELDLRYDEEMVMQRLEDEVCHE